jgi:hypothetical protein
MIERSITYARCLERSDVPKSAGSGAMSPCFRLKPQEHESTGAQQSDRADESENHLLPASRTATVFSRNAECNERGNEDCRRHDEDGCRDMCGDLSDASRHNLERTILTGAQRASLRKFRSSAAVCRGQTPGFFGASEGGAGSSRLRCARSAMARSSMASLTAKPRAWATG